MQGRTVPMMPPAMSTIVQVSVPKLATQLRFSVAKAPELAVGSNEDTGATVRPGKKA